MPSRDSMKNENRPSVSCYGCGNPGYIKAKCPNCTQQNTKAANFSQIRLQSASTTHRQTAVIAVEINGVPGTVCADTAATHSIAGESLYKLLREKGNDFQHTTLTIVLADGSKQEKKYILLV